MTFRYYDGYSPFVIVLNMMVLKFVKDNLELLELAKTFGTMSNMMVLKHHNMFILKLLFFIRC